MLLALLKPDVVMDGNMDAALAAIEEEGFTIIQQDLRMLTLATARAFYQEHEGKDFFDEIVKYICRWARRPAHALPPAAATAADRARAPAQRAGHGAAAVQARRRHRQLPRPDGPHQR